MLKRLKQLSISQKILAILGLLIFLLFSPLVSFIFNFGSVVGMVIGLAVMLASVFSDKIKSVLKNTLSKKLGKVIICTVCVIALVAVCYCSIVSVKVLTYSNNDSNIPQNTPAILLGCKVDGNNPGKMLAKRINAAYDYLTENPDAVCVLSGGQGRDEKITEAQAMYNTLTGKGISADRLIIEDKSTNTKENITNSKALLGDIDEAVIITTDFHQYRTSIIAGRNGLKTYSYSSKSGIFSLPTNVVREWFSVFKVLVTN